MKQHGSCLREFKCSPKPLMIACNARVVQDQEVKQNEMQVPAFRDAIRVSMSSFVKKKNQK